MPNWPQPVQVLDFVHENWKEPSAGLYYKDFGFRDIKSGDFNRSLDYEEAPIDSPPSYEEIEIKWSVWVQITCF